MKKLVLFLMLLFVTVCGYSQTMSQAYINAKYLANNNGYTISWDKQGYASKGSYIYNDYTFSAGTTYLIYAMSEDSDVTDVDIILYNSDGSVYTKDVTTDSNAAVVFTPYYNVVLRVTVKNYNSYDNYHKSLLRYYISYK